MRMMRCAGVILGMFLIGFGPFESSAQDGARGLEAGVTLGSDNWQLAQDLLPPEILEHYETGRFRNEIVDYPLGQPRWEKPFLEATEKNAGQLDVDAVGTIVYAATGKQPEYLYGIPFPVIDPADPKAAVMVVWNQFLAYGSGGSSFNVALLASRSSPCSIQPAWIARSMPTAISDPI